MSTKDELDALMRAQGIHRPGQGPGPKGHPAKPTPQAPPAPTTQQLQALHKRLGAAARPTRPKKKASSVSIPPVDPEARLVGATRRQEQLAVLLGEVDALAARTLHAEEQAKRLVKREREAKLRAEQATGELGTLRRELAQAQARIRTLEGALGQAEDLSSSARAAQSAAQAQADALRTEQAPSPTLQQLLRARGLNEDTELWEALVALADQCPELLLGGLRATSDGALARGLRERLVLLGPEQSPAPGMVAVSVPPERCELGESGLSTRFSELVEAAELAGVAQMALVGGSVAYRKTLRHLAQEHPLKLRLVSGTGRRQKRQAEADLRTCQVVVLWGGTELDHAVSELYRGEQVWTVAHRGMSGMLAELAARLLERVP